MRHSIMNYSVIKIIAMLFMISGVFSGLACQNTVNKNSAQTSGSTSPSPAPTTGSLSKLVPSTARVGAASGGSSKPTFDILFDPTKSEPVTNYCNMLTASVGDDEAKPCFCEFSWVEAGTVPLPRKVQSKLVAVQRSMAQCEMPSVFESEIKDGAKMEVNLKASSGNPTDFKRVAIAYTKNPGQQVGDFIDQDGSAYQNVYRYTCHDKVKKGIEITNFESSVSNVRLIAANLFCFRKSNRSTSSDAECALTPQNSHSAEAYYYNFYSPSKLLSDINTGNSVYSCPIIKTYPGDQGPAILTGAPKPYWPLDSQFALATSQTQKFVVPVEAYSRPYPATGTGNASEVGSRCIAQKKSPTPAGSSSADPTLVLSCMGFATKPNADASCPTLRDPDGKSIPTFRLRRYVAALPPRYEPSGEQLEGYGQTVDVTYILDRPVGAATNPIDAILGPKPCPFAFYDQRKTLFQDAHPNQTGGGREYVGVNRTTRHIGTQKMKGWLGVNVDGTQLPYSSQNTDRSDAGYYSTPALKPIFTTRGVTFKTLNQSERLHVRPVSREINIHYEEDHEFYACAPRSNTFRETPLHFYKAANKDVRWCAEVYPNRNMTNYFDASTNQTRSLNKGTELAAIDVDGVDLVNSPKHCSNAGGGCTRATEASDPKEISMPLLAPALDVEELLARDASYGCRLESALSTTAAGTPTAGCCANLSINIGKGAHLEPNQTCSSPTAP